MQFHIAWQCARINILYHIWKIKNDFFFTNVTQNNFYMTLWFVNMHPPIIIDLDADAKGGNGSDASMSVDIPMH